jgi:hypothetical protein
MRALLGGIMIPRMVSVLNLKAVDNALQQYAVVTSTHDSLELF